MILKDIFLAKKYLNLNKNASDRSLEFKLSIQDVAELLNIEECYYTGKKITKANRSIERLDSTRGYTKENCVVVDRSINSLKADLSWDEIKALQSLTNKQIDALDHFYKRNGWTVDGLAKIKTIKNNVYKQNKLA